MITTRKSGYTERHGSAMSRNDADARGTEGRPVRPRTERA